MRFIHLTAGAILATAAAALAPAHAANIVTNGSFEGGLAGWTIGGVETQGYPPAAIYYGAAQPYPNGAFGEAVPANNAPTNSPDAAGSRAAYFVSDYAFNQSLSQTVFLTPGTYQIGFSAYAPANGYANINDATFSGSEAGVVLANYNVGSGPATTWQTFSGVANVTIAGNYLIDFVFNTNGYPAKDVVIDQVYLISGNPSIPEPATFAVLGSALLGFGLIRRARRS